MNLDTDQRAAIGANQPRIFVAAGPGSGKTRVLVERIKNRIANGCHPSGMVVITFTNAGAHELAERLGHVKLGYLGTLHGYCFRLLQRYGSALGYREGGINLVGEEMAVDLLAEVVAFLKYKGSQKALKEAKGIKEQMVWKEYRHRLKRNNLVDYDGVLEQALRLITASEDGFDVDELYVDEGQDSALVDWDIYEALGADVFFCVGDPDQSIFAFRGAYPKGFVDQAAASHCLIKLENNYRSGDMICAAATALIRHNTGRIDKVTRAVAEFGTGIVDFTRHNTDAQERQHVANCVYGYIHGQVAKVRYGEMKPFTVPASEIAILVRTNALAQQFRDTLSAAGIPVRGHRLGPQLPPDYRYALDVLSLFADPRSDLIAERVMKHAWPNKLPAAKSRAAAEGEWLSISAYEVGGLPIVNHPMTMVGIPNDIARFGVSMETCDLVRDRIALLPQPNPTLADLRHDLYRSDLWQQQEDDHGGVSVLTLHAAKGREWDVVFLPAWEETVLPAGRKDTDIEEERRLAFVGITRARHEVHISSASERRGEFKTSNNQPSRFITEAGI